MATTTKELAQAMLLYISAEIKLLGDDWPDTDGMNIKYSPDKSSLLVSCFKDEVDDLGVVTERISSIWMEFPLYAVLSPNPELIVRELLIGYAKEWSH